ncbi:RluA family pseudouridine synthase [Rubripirellula reticaptiva]|uniref:Pseudouridine synthase n=1 Tax=Rubripirellula reticaptiva TaxID=2528013 RepID=A0A5C6F9I2_9BACT|nr:RluA family pseudouridine synthase [Rubripirellula reticaptiva]TWU58065.1 Ribosomal large subunit pseudouridine synthase A [Rubripirellula reticaptiva]
MIKTFRFDPLPGARPYENPRSMRVRRHQAGLSLLNFLLEFHPPTRRQSWLDWIAAGDITIDGQCAQADRVVLAGERYVHTMHDVCEPDVAPEVVVLHEDDAIIVVDKPAPMPVHPSGRFNRNTLLCLLQTVYLDDKLRMAHRLDANTTGVVVVCRTAAAATSIQTQFANRQVKKQYAAVVHGHVTWDDYVCQLPIQSSADLSPKQNTIGSRTVHPDGLPAETIFRVLERLHDNTTRIEAIPITGRTNQIRVHLWAMGFPIVGDPLYLPGGKLGQQQTLGVGDPPMRLHAARLMFVHPQTGREVSFESRSKATD